MGKRSTVYNNIVGDKYELVNEDNQELLEEWKEYMTSVDRSQKTIDSYSGDFKIWCVWNFENNKDKFFVEITKRDVIKFQNYCLKLGHSPSRVRRLRSTLSSLSNYIENILDDDFPNFRNIINKIEAPSLTKVREKLVLSEEEVIKLLDGLVENGYIQQACYFALAAYCGARKSELLRFKIDFFNDEFVENGLYATPEKIKTKGRGTNGKMLTKYTIKKYFDPYLELWKVERDRLEIDSEWLFVTKENHEWVGAKISTANSFADTASKILGDTVYSHSFRHALCTALYHANIPAEIVKDLFGWAGVGMVSLYTDVEGSDEFGKYFGDDGVKENSDNGSLNNL
jgi:integrase